MLALIENHRPALFAICREFGVRRLELFGSAADENSFDPESSDLDFIVEFLPNQSLGPWLSHYSTLKSRLEQLFGRSVDLVLHSALRPGKFLEHANQNRAVLYAA